MGKLQLNRRPSSLPESSAHTKNSLFVEICHKERDWRKGTGFIIAEMPDVLTASQS